MSFFYLDENVSRDAESLLSQYGHDTLHCVDAGQRGRPDPELLQAAAAAGRTLVTFNWRDFRLLHQFWTALYYWGTLGRPHGGILTSLREIDDIRWANLVHVFVTERPALTNQMWEWRPQQGRWFPFGW